MSGIKRNINSEDDSLISNDINEDPPSPTDSPNSKRLRHASSHSDIEADTQIAEQENGITNGHSTSQSETEEEDEEEEEEEINNANNTQDTSLQYSVVHVDFDDGTNDKFRYDGNIVFHIRIPTRLPVNQVSSEPTIIRTFNWILLAFFKPVYDNLQNDITGELGLFLKCVSDKISQTSSIYAKAELTLLHATDPNKNFVKKIDHIFNIRSIDWGFHHFKSLRDVVNEYLHVPDNTIRIEAKIHADPPRHVDWDSKGQTGFVGLRNIGATCYMNSFLQTIYFTKKLRKAVYALPTDNDDQLHSIPLALQKLFYDLQFTDRPMSTKRLTRSFGWDKPDEFCQHDIQEFCRVLLDKLESKMEGTTMEGVIPSLFQGQYVQYVRCTKVDQESRVKQTFYDVPLQVRNNANITESFRDFCKTEILTGDNLYDAGVVHGLQEAEKGVKFQKFPPVLCLHLLRFEYDYNLFQNRKINDSYSFDYHLDLSEFLENPNCSPCTYKLLSILVHSGDNSSGHYVSFINPNLDGQWFKFDDDIVAHVAPTDAMERNFGGTNENDRSMCNTSAYMLVYIREDCQKDVLCDIDQEDIPETLIKRFDYDKKFPIKRRQILSDNDTFVDIHIILNDDFYIRPAICLTNIFYENTIDFHSKYNVRYIETQRLELFSVFARRLAHEMGVNLNEDIRIWILKTHETPTNHHYRSQSIFTCSLVYCDDYDKKINDLFDNEIINRRILLIFVEQKIYLNNIYQLLSFDKDDDILLFVRLYNSRDESLLYIGHFLFSQQQTLQKCLNDIARRIKFSISPSTKYTVHQNIPRPNQIDRYESIKLSNFDLPLSQALYSCSSGLSIIIQLFDVNQTNNDNELTTVDHYFQNRSASQEFDVCNRDSLRNECLFKLNIPLATSIKEVIQLIAERIEYPAQQIIILKSSPSPITTNTTSSTSSSLHIGSEQKLRDLYLNIRSPANSVRKILFKRLPFNYTELERHRLFRVFVTNPMKKDEQRDIQVYIRKPSTVAEFLEEIKQWLPSLYSKNGGQQLRLVQLALHHQINSPFQLRVCSDRTSMNELENILNHFYHLEEVINDEIDQNKDNILIPVAHYTKENSIQINYQKVFPFFLNVIHNESFGDVKQRLQIKLGLTNREFEKYRFSIFNGNKLISRCEDNMGRINLRELKSTQNSCWLGLELPSISNPRKTRKSFFSEKPIRIN